MPNTKGPQIQIKDKRNEFIMKSAYSVLDKNDTYEQLLQRRNKLSGDDPRKEGIDNMLMTTSNNMRNEARMNKRVDIQFDPDGYYEQAHFQDGKYLNNQSSGVFSKPKGSSYTKGDYTGATRAPHPPVHKPFGNNTRATVYPFEKQGTKLTGLLDNHYDPKVLSPPGQNAAQRLLPSGATTIQGGTPSVLRGIKQLRPGSGHWLFS